MCILRGSQGSAASIFGSGVLKFGSGLPLVCKAKLSCGVGRKARGLHSTIELRALGLAFEGIW